MSPPQVTKVTTPTASYCPPSPLLEEPEQTASSLDPIDVAAAAAAAAEEKRLEELYQAAKDENELLEFKNYELLFKIQELEQNQRKIQSELDSVAATESKARKPEEARAVVQKQQQQQQQQQQEQSTPAAGGRLSGTNTGGGVAQNLQLTSAAKKTPTTNPVPVKSDAMVEHHNGFHIDGDDEAGTIMNGDCNATAAAAKLGQQVAQQLAAPTAATCCGRLPTEAEPTSARPDQKEDADAAKLVAPKLATSGSAGNKSLQLEQQQKELSKPFNATSTPVKSSSSSSTLAATIGGSGEHLGHENMDNDEDVVVADFAQRDYSPMLPFNAGRMQGLHDTQLAGNKHQPTGSCGDTSRCCSNQQVICAECSGCDGDQLIEYNGCAAVAAAAAKSCSSFQQQVGGSNHNSTDVHLLLPLTSDAGQAKVMSGDGAETRVSMHFNGLSSSSSPLQSTALANHHDDSSSATSGTTSLPVSAEFANGQQRTQQQQQQRNKPLASKQVSSNMAPSTSRKLGQEAKKLAQSQPNLLSGKPAAHQVSTSSAATASKRPQMARIAVPVTRASLLANKPAATHHQVSGKQATASSPVTNHLRVRSKSSLDQSSSMLPRQTAAKRSILKQRSSATAAAATTTAKIAPKLSSSSNSDNSNHESFSKTSAGSTCNRAPVATATVSSSGIPALANQQLVAGQPLTNRHRSRSALSMSFVTQIPTLISQQQQPKEIQMPATGASAQSVSAHCSPMSAPVAGIAFNSTSGAKRRRPLADISAEHSKSMSSLALAASSTLQAQTAATGDNQHDVDVDDDDDDELAGSGKGNDGKTSLLAPAAISSRARGSYSTSCVSLVSSTKSEQPVDGDQLDEATTKTTATTTTSTLNIERNSPIGQPDPLPKATLVSDHLQQQQQQPSQTPTNNSHNLLAAQTRDCAQCKLLQSKLNLLIMDRKQQSEQINELEEMENDSRLMSQKLQQQLVQCELQLDECKSQLQLKHDNESRLEFQNKRLNFELQQLQGQLKQSTGLLRRLQQQQQQQKLRFSSTSSDGCNAEKAERNNGIDLTRNEQPPLPLRSRLSSSTAQSVAQINDEQQQQPLVAKEATGATCAIELDSMDAADRQDAVATQLMSQSNSDDDSAIDLFDNKLPLTARDSSKPEVMPRASEQQVPTTSADDSAYSKSSASSDANSDDGRSDSHQQSAHTTTTATDLLIEELAETSDEHRSSIGDDDQVVVVSAAAATTTVDITKASASSEQPQVHLASSSTSSGDESDYHDSATTTITATTTATTTTTTTISADQQQQLSNQQQVNQQLQHCVNHLSTSTAATLTGRQQVLRKKISTARILRGIQQVQQSPGSSLATTTTTTTTAEPPTRVRQPPVAPLVNQAVLAQVVPTTTTVTTTEATCYSTAHQDMQTTDKDQLIVRKSNDNEAQQQLTSQRSFVKSSIELALAGVEQLEQGQTDEVLKSLLRSSSSSKIRQLDSEQVVISTPPPSPPLAPPMTRPRQQQSGSAINTVSQQQHLRQVIEQFKQEIAALKMRLIQTQTLNDNLVAELKSSSARGQQQQVVLPTRSSLLANHHHQQQQRLQNCFTIDAIAELQQQVDDRKSATKTSNTKDQNLLQPPVASLTTAATATTTTATHQPLQPKQRSVVYLNGVRTSVTHQQTTLISGSTTPAVAAGVANQQTGKSNDSTVHQYGDNNRQHAACIEFVDFLKLLLDKIHFHHERTFELVNESHKLAMNALLASYNHKMNLIHHNSAILAGNQAATYYSSSNREFEQHQLQQEVSASQAARAQQQPATDCHLLYPVRPPPRRRNVLTANGKGYVAVASNEHQILSAANNDGQPDEQQQQQQQQQQQTVSGRSSTSALQVAKQTLFSIVPIHYNSSSGHKNNKEKSKGNSSNNSDSNNYSKNNENNHKVNDTPVAAKLNNKSKSWILLNHKSSDTTKVTNQNEQQQQLTTDYVSLEGSYVNRYQNNQQQQQQIHKNNVSVLEISRSNDISSSTNNIYATPDDQRAYHSLPPVYAHHHSTTASVIAAQQLVQVKNSLSEDIERYRVRFNGQLLDLLTRQNWCESIIVDKLKIYQSTRTIYRHHHQQVHLMDSSLMANENGANVIASRQANLPISNNICLNPNGLAQQHQSADHLQQQQKTNISMHNSQNASFC